MQTSTFHLVSIGGGNGAGQVLAGAAPFFARRTGVIAVTDSGRSTGLARAIAGIPAPGDIRNTVATLASDPNSPFTRLLQHRLRATALPELEGMAMGNLILGALAQMTGDFAQAVELLGNLVGTAARVLPVSSANTDLCAELDDGTLVESELAVRGLNKPPIKRLLLKSQAVAYPPALDAIREADIITIGPGSLFTTVLATLLFDGVVEALRDTDALVVYVCNTTTQPGQTDGYTMLNHIERIAEALGPGILDVALVNRSDPDPAVLSQYAADGVYLLRPDDEQIAAIERMDVRPVVQDFTERSSGKRELWNKQDSIRHDPAVIGATLGELARETRDTRHKTRVRVT